MNINDLFSDDLADAGKRLWERRRRQVIESKKTKSLTRDIDEGVMSDLDQDLQDVRWDEIVSAVQLAVKTSQNAEEIVKRMSRNSGIKLTTINQEIKDRGFADISDLEDYIESSGGKYTPPSFDLRQIVDNDQKLDEIIRKVDGNKYRLYSKKGKNLGTFDSRAGAEKHEREVQYFKHIKESTVTDKEVEEYLAEMRSAGYGV